MDGILTLEKLKSMSPGEIFATGKGFYIEIRPQLISWIACRGKGYHDWCIYYGLRGMTDTDISMHGDKVFTEKMIKKMVPCDEEAWKMYRF